VWDIFIYANTASLPLTALALGVLAVDTGAGATGFTIVNGAVATIFLTLGAGAAATGAGATALGAAARSAAFLARPAAILARNSSLDTGIFIIVAD
jgi:hypothetical protein